MKVGFISLSVPGHFHPMSAVARQLQSRNHDVVVLSLPVMELFARAANLPFIPFGEKEFPIEHSSEVVGTLSRLKGEEAPIVPGSRKVLANLILKALIGLNSSITPVRSMTEKAGQSSVFHGTD
jgi:hypothetical protein